MTQEHIHQSHEQSGALFQKLKQLQGRTQIDDFLHEANQLIGDIDNALANVNLPVIKNALKSAGLSLEEAVLLLKNSRSLVHQLVNSKRSQSAWIQNTSPTSVPSRSMGYPINFYPSQSIEGQFDDIIDTASKSCDDPNGERNLRAYSQEISNLFAGSGQDPSPLISWLEDAKSTSALDGHDRIAAAIETVLGFLRM